MNRKLPFKIIRTGISESEAFRMPRIYRPVHKAMTNNKNTHLQFEFMSRGVIVRFGQPKFQDPTNSLEGERHSLLLELER